MTTSPDVEEKDRSPESESPNQEPEQTWEPSDPEPASAENAVDREEDLTGESEGGAGADNGEASEESLGTTATVETLGPCKLKIHAEVPAEKVTELLDRNYRDLMNTLQLPGFRRGRVPRALVEKRYGEDVEKDLKDALLNDSFLEVVEEHSLRLVGQPDFGEVQFERDAPFKYQADCEIWPSFEIETYEGIEVERQVEPVEDSAVDEEIESLRRAHGTVVPVERGDLRVDDYIYGKARILKDGEQVAEIPAVGFQLEDHQIQGMEVPDLKDRLDAFREAATQTISVTLPSHAHFEIDDQHFGTDADLEVTIDEVKRVELAELNDELAKKLQAETVDELRKGVRENLEKRSGWTADRKVEDEILEKILAATEFELPEGLLERQKNSRKLRMQMDLIQQGKTREQIDEELKKADSQADDDKVRTDLRRFFILEQIADKEKIYATEEELRYRILALAEMYQRKPQDVIQELESSGGLEELRLEIRHLKVRKYLREKAKVAGGEDAEASQETPAAETTAEPPEKIENS